MIEKRQWSQQQDNLLKFIFQKCKISRWSHIAQIMHDDYGIEGRNGKQCKERFITHIDPHYFKEQWRDEEDKNMMELHNNIGNKWAIIGSILGNKSDNQVKNRFYSKLRRGLKKLNNIVISSHHKQFKDIKSNSLYRIVQIAQQNFKLPDNHDKQFSALANQLKNQLFCFASQGEMDDQNQDQTLMVRKGEELILKMNQFVNAYKRRHRKQTNIGEKEGENEGLLKPKKYNGVSSSHSNGDNEQSSGSGDINASSIPSNLSQLSEDQINKTGNYKKRRHSMSTSPQCLQLSVNKRMITRATSQGNLQSLLHQEPNIQKMDIEIMNNQNDHTKVQQNIQSMLDSLDILQSQVLMNPILMKKNSSKYSYFPQRNAQEQQFYFFEDSQMNVRIFPEVHLMAKIDSQYQESLF